ncbi:hypothetical protein ACFU7Y_01325 [Kitasatospora sp. NPDC057542]|uniref:hypothetical protein n=1 Tax=Streptomycetaceae TaxID=2062 RepID=UPI001CCFF9B6|nr:hypothetical protein [Streptomyces sp. LS1784]
MTITTGAPPRRNTPIALARGFLTGGVIGGSLAAMVVGVVIEKVPLLIAGLGIPIVYGLLLLLAGWPRRAREAAVVPRTALATVESLNVPEGEVTDRSVRFDLTVVPDDGPAFRVEFTQDINVADLPDYRPRGVLVVRYPPDRPWLVRIVKRPTPEWEERAAGARLDSVPGPVRVSAPPEARGVGFVGLLGFLLGAAAVVLLFRVDLFEREAADPPSSSATPSVSSSWSSRVVSAGSGTVVLGPGRSFLDDGELPRAVDSLTMERDSRQAIAVVVQENLLSVVFSPTGAKTPDFDPLSLPYERFPALVEEARTTLGAHAPQTWQLTADRLAGALTIRISVTGPEGNAVLEADEQGRVLRRTSVH